MLKLLIFSDSHGHTRAMEAALRRNPDADAVLFLGDGAADIAMLAAAYPGHSYTAVKGNNDFSSITLGSPLLPLEELFLEGHHILMTHGHLYGVRSGCGMLVSLAERKDADIVLFGHTHVPFEHFERIGERGVYFFNPGSIGEPHSGNPSFGLLTLDGNTVLFSHGEIE